MVNWKAKIVLTVLLLTTLYLYVSLYFATVKRTYFLSDNSKLGTPELSLRTQAQYQVGGTGAAVLFFPVHMVDVFLRREYWSSPFLPPVRELMIREGRWAVVDPER